MNFSFSNLLLKSLILSSSSVKISEYRERYSGKYKASLKLEFSPMEEKLMVNSKIYSQFFGRLKLLLMRENTHYLFKYLNYNLGRSLLFIRLQLHLQEYKILDFESSLTFGRNIVFCLIPCFYLLLLSIFFCLIPCFYFLLL